MQLRIPMVFQLSLSRIRFHECTAQNCSDIPRGSHYQSTNLYPLFLSLFLEPLFTLFPAVELEMLQNCSKVC